MTDTNYTNVEQQKELMKFISDNMKIPVLGAGGGFAPIGTIIARMSSTTPQGFLLCDGTVYNISDYPDLATHFASDPEIGSVNFFGGNGTTTFAVPDLRGEFLRGTGTNGHTNQGSGANVGVHQDGTLHLGTYARSSNNGLVVSNNDTGSVKYPQNVDYLDNQTGSLSKNRALVNNSSVEQNNVALDYTSRPTNTSVNFYIKATVSGDANAHVYSTEEQVVGTTENGEIIYEKTFNNLSASVTTETTWQTVVEITNSKQLIDAKIYSHPSDVDVLETAKAYIITNGIFKVAGVQFMARIITKAIVRYTKQSS